MMANPMEAILIEKATRRPTGRPGRYRKYEDLLASLAERTTKRATYCDQIGLFRGERGVTVWVKIRTGKGKAKEIKLGALASWDWGKLEEKRNELQGRADRGEPLEDAPVQTFGGYADDWLTRKKSTAKRYGDLKGHVENHLKPTFGLKPLSAITVAEVNAWIARQRQSMKPATVQRQLSTFNAILNDAVRSSVIIRNPANLADPIKGIEPRQRFLDQEELKVLLESADAIEAEEIQNAERRPQEKRGWLRNFILWSINTGMRRQEILNLTWRDLRQIDDKSAMVDVGTLKGGNPRMLNRHEALAGIIEAMRKLDREEGDDRVFPVSSMTARRKLKRLFDATGISDIRLHDLRRTHATALVNAGVDIRTVAQRLGHKDTKMLMKVYAAHVSDEAAATKTQEIFGHLSLSKTDRPANPRLPAETLAAPEMLEIGDIAP